MHDLKLLTYEHHIAASDVTSHNTRANRRHSGPPVGPRATLSAVVSYQPHLNDNDWRRLASVLRSFIAQRDCSVAASRLRSSSSSFSALGVGGRPQETFSRAVSTRRWSSSWTVSRWGSDVCVCRRRRRDGQDSCELLQLPEENCASVSPGPALCNYPLGLPRTRVSDTVVCPPRRTLSSASREQSFCPVNS